MLKAKVVVLGFACVIIIVFRQGAHSGEKGIQNPNLLKVAGYELCKIGYLVQTT